MVWMINPTADRGDEMKDMVLENLSCSGSVASPESSFSYVSCKQSLAKESFKFLSKYLATFAAEDAYIYIYILSEAKEETVRTIVEFVKAPDLFQVRASTLAGQMVVLKKTGCYFALKVWNAQEAGATAVFVLED